MKVDIEPSAAGIRLFPPDHQHSWQFAQASPYYLFGKRWGGCAIGASRHLSPFAFAYLRDPGFPTFVDDLVRRGLYDRHFLTGLFEDDGNSSASEAFSNGRRIAQEYWATHPNPSVEATFHELYGAAA
jgi:hypothetical protein